MRRRLIGLRDRRPALVAFEHVLDLLLDHGQGLDHVADALAAEVLEIAGLVDLHHVILNLLRQAAFVIGLHRGGERLGAVVDHLRRFQNLLGRLFHAFDRGAELAGGARHVTLAAFADERGEFAHGVGDGVVELGEFALERLRRFLVGGSLCAGAGLVSAILSGVALFAGRAAVRPPNIRSTRKTLRCTRCPLATPNDAFYQSAH